LYGWNVITAGWGTSNDGTVSEHMETVQLTILTKRQCNKQVNECGNVRTKIPDSIICTVAQPFALIGNVSIEQVVLILCLKRISYNNIY
jgi:hypothetical protein